MKVEFLLPIQSQHLVHILNGDKTLELRKLLPKNFDGLVKKHGGIWVNLYCTKGGEGLYFDYLGRDWFLYDEGNASNKIIHNGKVVARFWFDEYSFIEYDEETPLMDYDYDYDDNVVEYIVEESSYAVSLRTLKELCLTYTELDAYGKGKDLYAWHIKRLEIFDKPKELSDFYKRTYLGDETIKHQYRKRGILSEIYLKPLTKAPQSFRYVYVKGEK